MAMGFGDDEVLMQGWEVVGGCLAVAKPTHHSDEAEVDAPRYGPWVVSGPVVLTLLAPPAGGSRAGAEVTVVAAPATLIGTCVALRSEQAGALGPTHVGDARSSNAGPRAARTTKVCCED